MATKKPRSKKPRSKKPRSKEPRSKKPRSKEPRSNAPPRASTRKPDLTRLTRHLQPMPAFVRRALTQAGLLRAYRARPAYQQNDYLGWINRAKLSATRERRLRQMLEELEGGTLYMKMRYRPARP